MTAPHNAMLSWQGQSTFGFEDKTHKMTNMNHILVSVHSSHWTVHVHTLYTHWSSSLALLHIHTYKHTQSWWSKQAVCHIEHSCFRSVCEIITISGYWHAAQEGGEWLQLSQDASTTLDTKPVLLESPIPVLSPIRRPLHHQSNHSH